MRHIPLRLTTPGATSTVAIASNLYQAATSPTGATKSGTSPSSTRRIDEHSRIDALLNPSNASTEDYTPRRPVTTASDDIRNKAIADRHFKSYFDTIHCLLPVLHEGAFRSLYDGYWSRLGCEEMTPSTEMNLRKITAPLIYSVLALGALYEENHPDHAFWAKEWFAKAREGVSNAVDECCFEICLAVYYVVFKDAEILELIHRLPTLSMSLSPTWRTTILESQSV